MKHSFWFALITLTLVSSPAFAASKADVAAAGCVTDFDTVRKAHRVDHLRYRLISGQKCWYSDVALAAKKAASKVATSIPRRVIKSIIIKAVQPPIDPPVEDLDSIFLNLCGGPCPQLKGERQNQWPQRME